MWRPEVKRETASGNRIDLFTIVFRDDQLNCKWITANTSDMTKPSDFNCNKKMSAHLTKMFIN